MGSPRRSGSLRSPCSEASYPTRQHCRSHPLCRAVERVAGVSINVRPVVRRPGDTAVLVADPARAEMLLSWHPEFSTLERIVSTAWHWRILVPRSNSATTDSSLRPQACRLLLLKVNANTIILKSYSSPRSTRYSGLESTRAPSCVAPSDRRTQLQRCFAFHRSAIFVSYVSSTGALRDVCHDNRRRE